MSKIKSKDLSYDQNLPPFLQRLRAQNAGRGDADRHEREIARPKKAHVADEEDEPTIVDESGEVVTPSDLKKRSETESATLHDPINASSTTKEPQKDLVDASKVSKKRKVAKMIGADASDEPREQHPPTQIASKTVPKKKSKPIKLAFNEEDDDD